MIEPDAATENAIDAAQLSPARRPRAARVGRPRRGAIRDKTLSDIPVTTPTSLPAGARAFIVIGDSGVPPIVGLVEVVDQRAMNKAVALAQ